MDKLIMGAHYLASAILVATIINIIIVLLQAFRGVKVKFSNIVIDYIYIVYIVTVGFITGIFYINAWHFPVGINYNLIPFVNDSFKLILLNILLFVPFGLLTPIIFIGKVNRFKVTIIYSVILCMSIEIIQMLCLGRVGDIDDIVMNVLGSLIGYTIFILIDKTAKKYLAENIIRYSATPMILNCIILLLGFSYKKISIADVILISYGINPWSKSTLATYSMSGVHYTVIIAVCLLMVPLSISIVNIRKHNCGNVTLFTTIVLITYYGILLVSQTIYA